jgi:zinc resistance-associated protein
MFRHIPIAAALTVALVALGPFVPFQALAQDERAVLGDYFDYDPDASDAYAQSDRQGGLKQALNLSAEQEKLWASVEEALTNLREQRRALRSAVTASEPTDQLQWLRRRAELSSQRADALKKLADAVQPLWATLSEEQKRTLTQNLSLAPSRADQERRTSRREDDDLGMRHHRGRYDYQDRADRDRRGRDEGEWRYHRDRMMGRRGDDDDDMDGGRFDRYQSRRPYDDDRPRLRRFDRDRFDFDRRSDRDYCRCDRRY